MKTLFRFPSMLAALAGICIPFVTPAFGTVNIEYVIVGNPGNAADTRVASDSTTGYGAVGYVYRIGKYEVTNAQYCQFLNAKGSSNSAGIYNSGMSTYGITQSGTSGSFTYAVTSGLENRPVENVSWFDAARFCNWLVNGQGSGNMETGAYTLNGAISGIITVNPGATVHIPSEDEWYKAAYYQATTAEYNSSPFLMGVGGSMNYNNYLGRSTDVGYYSGYPSFYGTFDQAGNAQEWNDAVIGPYRGVRGGGYADSIYSVGAWRRSFDTPSDEDGSRGFRVASVLPSPSVTTGATSEINGVSVILQGTVNPNRITTTAQFEYGLTTAYGSTAAVTLSPNSGSTPQDVSAGISGLQPGQVYHYRLTATNAGGTITGADMTFVTRCVLTITALHGTVQGAGRYDANSTVELTATPDPGYVFSEWTGDATGDTNPLAIVMTSDKTITGVFEQDTRDSDGDGLTNHQEIVVYGTNPAKQDTDGDGFLDGYEIQTGKSPLDIADHPALVAEARTAIEFTFPSALGKTYRIEGSPDMSIWTTVESGIAGNGGQILRFYSTRNVPQRFLRVEEISAP